MNRHLRMASTTVRVKLPQGVAVGRVIGKGGSNTKAIAANHSVRCFVDGEVGEAVVIGRKDKVEAAISELEVLFEQLRMTSQTPRRNQQSFRADRGGTTPIHVIAVVRKPGDVWRFEQPVDAQSVGDPNVRDFAYRLVTSNSAADTTNSAPERRSRAWLREFDSLLVQEMVRDAASFQSVSGSQVKLKAVFGMTCFSLPDRELATQTFTWDQLVALKLYKQVKLRWANGCNTASALVCALVKRLQDLLAKDAQLQTVLTVFIGERGSKKGDGMSVKFRLDGEAWIPLKHRPVRVVHGLYSVALDSDTAFRIRACSREQSTHGNSTVDPVEHLTISSAASGDIFQTEVQQAAGFPSTQEIRSFSVKQKTHIDADGLRFTFSYMDAARTDVKIECRMAPPSDQADAEAVLPLRETMHALIDKLLVLLNCSVDWTA